MGCISEAMGCISEDEMNSDRRMISQSLAMGCVSQAMGHISDDDMNSNRWVISQSMAMGYISDQMGHISEFAGCYLSSCDTFSRCVHRPVEQPAQHLVRL